MSHRMISINRIIFPCQKVLQILKSICSHTMCFFVKRTITQENMASSIQSLIQNILIKFYNHNHIINTFITNVNKKIDKT